MGIISQWRTFAWEHPAKALLLTIIPLAFLMLLGYTFHSAVYDSAMPGALAGTIIALYLALTLFLGLTTQGNRVLIRTLELYKMEEIG